MKSVFSKLSLLSLFVLASGATLTAQTLYFGPTGNGGSGTWDAGTTADWSTSVGGSSVVWTNGDLGVFGGTAGTVTIASGGVSASGLTFNTTGYIVGNGGGPLTLTGTPTITTDAGGVDTLSPTAIADTVATSVAGTGKLIVVGSNATSFHLRMDGDAHHQFRRHRAVRQRHGCL